MKVTHEMVDRFLSWKLPDDFAPDCGIIFTPSSQWPVGTNLFTADQARTMLEHALRGPDNELAEALDMGARADAAYRHLRRDMDVLLTLLRCCRPALLDAISYAETAYNNNGVYRARAFLAHYDDFMKDPAPKAENEEGAA